MFGFEAVLLSVAATLNVATIALIYFRRPLTPHSSFYAIGALAIAFWAVTMLYFVLAPTQHAAVSALKGTYVAALLISLTLYFFSYSFPSGRTLPSSHSGIVVGIIGALIVFIELPSTMVQSLSLAPALRITVIPVHYYLFAAILLFFLTVSLGRIWMTYFKGGLSGELRSQLLAIAASATLSGSAGLLVGLLLPSPFFNDYRFFWTGPVFSFFLSTTVIYAIFRYRIFDAKVFIGELLVYILWIFTFARIMLAGGLEEHLINGALFIVSAFIGALLIRTMRSEVSAREHIEELVKNVESANAKLRVLDREKSEFVSIASHQLRSPLTSIKGYTALLLEGSYGKIPEKALEPLRRIEESGKNMALMTEDFLNVSRIDLGIMTYEKKPFDLCSLVKTIAADFEAVVREKKLTFSLTCPPQTLTVLGDEPKIRQVIGNLVDNAIKYTPQGSVEVGLLQEGREAVITVRDTGVGIPPESIDRLFGKFVRGKNANSANTHGSGLGLFVSKQFIEAHDGRITAHSKGQNKGSTFVVRLPLQENLH